MRATDHTEVKLFVLLLLVGIIEVVQEFLEETTFHRDRISRIQKQSPLSQEYA